MRGIYAGTYGYVFMVLAAFWPLFLLIWSVSPIIVVLLLALSCTLLGLVWRYTSSPKLSFAKGLEIVSMNVASGWANITIIYIFPYLFYIYFVYIYFTYRGFSLGRDYTQRHWSMFVKHHYDDIKAKQLKRKLSNPQQLQP